MYEYTYGNNNELREVRIPGLGAITIPGYTWNRPSNMIFPGGTQRVYGYDALMRLKSLTATDPGGNPLLNYAYKYNEVGNIMTKATEHGTYGYDYDALSRLTSVDNPVLDDESYTYDDVGNRLTAADVSGTWDYNANNELLGFADVEYTYDENGNMTQIKAAGQVVWTYVYDAANRLIHVEDGTGSISADYYYDPFGRRLWKDVGGERTYFFYSDEGLIGEYDASGNELRAYGYKPNSVWTTDPLFMKQGTEYYFYQNDHLGTLQKLVGVNGDVVWSAQYSAFGEAMVDVETVTNNLRMPGQYWDHETGLHYNFQRYYEPKIGRYLSADPIGVDGGDLNLYGYAHNNSVNQYDSLGMWAVELSSLLGRLTNLFVGRVATFEPTHEYITSVAFHEGRLALMPELSYSDSDGIGELLVRWNVKQDMAFNKSGYHHRHYAVEDPEQLDRGFAQQDYLKYLQKDEERFDIELSGSVLDQSFDGCLRALCFLGLLSHSWQDYYGHGLTTCSEKNPYGGYDVCPSLQDIGSPDNLVLIPSSGNKYTPPFLAGKTVLGNYMGEHPGMGVEPAPLSNSYELRVYQAIRFTEEKFKHYLKQWKEQCRCHISEFRSTGKYSEEDGILAGFEAEPPH